MIDPSITPASPAPTPPAGTPARQTRPPRRVRRETERLARLDQLAEMGELAAGLAHELKNPLSTLKLNLQLLEEDIASLPGAERSRARLITLKKEADRLRQTLDDFLRFAGRIELRTHPISLNAIVEDVLDFIHPQAQAHRIRLHAALTPENPRCRLDENLFKQALLNLLLNAIQAMAVERHPAPRPDPATRGPADPSHDGHSPDDAPGGELLVRTLVAKNQAILYVSDTGVGIPRDHLERIFDPYFTTKKGGTGLGLPTTRRIIEEHHGHISVTSEPARGTSFRVEIPLADSPPTSADRV